MGKLTMLPEWHRQDAVMMVWPHENTDWQDTLDAIRGCYADIIIKIIPFQKVVLITHSVSVFEHWFTTSQLDSIITVNIKTNDTWIRDFGPLTIEGEGKLKLLDFRFDGWGGKYEANFDSALNADLYKSDFFAKDIEMADYNDWVLEGGSLETDGKGNLLTTSSCLLDPARNGDVSKEEVEALLLNRLGLQKVYWLDHGALTGDDTDGHIDTLARFCDPSTIAYVTCDDPEDEHYHSLKQMEKELNSIARSNAYQLIPIPLPDACYGDDGRRLPATYLNFLIINQAVLVPVYQCSQDEEAIKIIKEIFPDRKVISVNCLPLIQQNGSLHCATMQLPEGVLNCKFVKR